MKRSSRLRTFLAAVASIFAFHPVGLAAGFHRGVNVASLSWEQYEGQGQVSEDQVGKYWPGWTPAGFIVPQSLWETLAVRTADHVRLPVHPWPLLQAANAPLRARLLEDLRDLIAQFRRRRMGVIVALAPSDPDQFVDLKQRLLTDPTIAADYARLLREVAHLVMATQGAAPVLLEPVNEPAHACDAGNDAHWADTQAAFVRAIEAAEPRLPVVVTGDCWSSLDGLLRLDVSRYSRDPKIYFTFHFYDPPIFTNQGEPWKRSDFAFLSRVPFPTTQHGIEMAREATLAAIQSRGSELSPEAREAVTTKLMRWLAGYEQNPWDQARIAQAATRASDWAKQHKIAPNRIILGEYGVFRSSSGAAPEDRARWLDAVEREFGSRGIATTVYSDSGGFGVDAK